MSNIAKFGFGDDFVDGKDVYQLMLWSISFLVISALGSAISDFKGLAAVYTDLATSALVFVILGLVLGGTFLTKKMLNFNAFIWEKGLIKGITLRQNILIALALGIFIFFFSSNTQFRIEAPLFQILEVTGVNSAIVSGLIGIIENLFFFGVVWPLMFFVIRWMIFKFGGGDDPLTALLSSGFLTPFIFLLYHNSVYGVDRVLTSAWVLFFGFVVVASIIAFGNFLIADSIHFFNNFGITLFTNTTLTTLFVTIFNSSPSYFVASVILLAATVGQTKRGSSGTATLLGVGSFLMLIIALNLMFT